MNVIDSGASIRIRAVAIAKKIGRKGELCAFEPVPEYFDILSKGFIL